MKSKILFILVLVLLIFLANAALNMYSKSKEAKSYLEATQQEFSNLEGQYNNAKEDLEYLNSGTGLERELRAKFDLAREGEKAVLIIEEDLPEIQEPEERTFWGKVKNWVSF